MLKSFKPLYAITPEMALLLIRIEAAKQAIADLPITYALLAKLRETARLVSTHYSTKIEGNRLSQEEVQQVIKFKGYFPGRERDASEVRGYYAALDYLEQWAATEKPISETLIQNLHALVMGDTITRGKPIAYRDGQNVIRDGLTGAIVYLPPEAKDVPGLMKELISWVNKNMNVLPVPLIAGIAHYQFVTIHPYYDGNGRVARLLATLILHLGGYGLKGIYSLEEYYARDLAAYYDALSVGPSHNYYFGREEADITGWVAYFCEGMAQACEKVKEQAKLGAKKGMLDQSPLLRNLDPQQRRVLELFRDYAQVSAKQIGELFGYKPRTSSALCKKWIEAGFIIIVDPSRKGRLYRLAPKYLKLIE